VEQGRPPTAAEAARRLRVGVEERCWPAAGGGDR
jgi:hypothetical protein